MCYLLWGGREERIGRQGLEVEGDGRGGAKWWMTPGQIPAAGDKPGELPRRRRNRLDHPILTTPHPSAHNQTWQNGDICRNIGYSLRHRPLPSPTATGRPPNCSRALKHLFQLALPLWPRDFAFSRCHLHITLNQNPQWETRREWGGVGEDKKEGVGKQTVAFRITGKDTLALYEMEMWQDIMVYCVWSVHVRVYIKRWWLHCNRKMNK